MNKKIIFVVVLLLFIIIITCHIYRSEIMDESKTARLTPPATSDDKPHKLVQEKHEQLESSKIRASNVNAEVNGAMTPSKPVRERLENVQGKVSNNISNNATPPAKMVRDKMENVLGKVSRSSTDQNGDRLPAKPVREKLENVQGKASSQSAEFEKKPSTTNIGVYFSKNNTSEVMENLRFTYSKVENNVSISSENLTEGQTSRVNR